MPSKAAIDEFLGHKKLALMRLSSDMPVPGARIDEELKTKGYEVEVVYLDGPAGGRRLAQVSDQVEGVIIAVPRKQGARAASEAIEAKMARVWLQAGSESPEAVSLLENKRVSVVSGACVLMYAEPVRSFHRFHRWLWKRLGLLAK